MYGYGGNSRFIKRKERWLVYGSMGESGRGRKQRFAKVEELSDITIFSDTSAIEIFINNGETVLTTRVYSEHLEQKVELVSREVKGSVHGYELGSFEVEYKK